MLHGSTGSIFGWVPCDLQARFSGQQFHMPWLQWVVNYTKVQLSTLQQGQTERIRFWMFPDIVSKNEMTFDLCDSKYSSAVM